VLAAETHRLDVVDREAVSVVRRQGRVDGLPADLACPVVALVDDGTVDVVDVEIGRGQPAPVPVLPDAPHVPGTMPHVVVVLPAVASGWIHLALPILQPRVPADPTVLLHPVGSRAVAVELRERLPLFTRRAPLLALLLRVFPDDRLKERDGAPVQRE
jgi:hypothetical protein